MLNNLISDISKIYIVYGATDFRKQIYSLCALIENNFKISAYDKVAFVSDKYVLIYFNIYNSKVVIY